MIPFFKSQKSPKSLEKPAPAPPSAPVLRVSDHLAEKAVHFFSNGVAKEDAFKALIGSLELSEPEKAFDEVMARENLGNTAIAPGILLPHARLSGISGVRAAIGIALQGIPKGGEEAAHIIVLFFSPLENRQEHLAFLSSVASLFQAEHIQEALLGLSSPTEVLMKIREIEKGA